MRLSVVPRMSVMRRSMRSAVIVSRTVYSPVSIRVVEKAKRGIRERREMLTDNTQKLGLLFGGRGAVVGYDPAFCTEQ